MLHAGGGAPSSSSTLQSLVERHGRVLERLASEHHVSPEELATGRALLRRVEAELSRVAPPPRTDPRRALEAAKLTWDPLGFEVPRSHRAGIGRLVTGAKRGALEGLKAVHADLAKGQRALNQQVLDMLVHVVDGHFASGEGLSRIAAATLEAFDADARRPLKRTTQALKQVLEPVLDRQRGWNRRVLALLTGLPPRGQRVPTSPVHEALGGLLQVGRMAEPAEVAGLRRAVAPLWIELFRRQAAFNEGVALTLMGLYGLPCRPEDGNTGYPEVMHAHEARRAAEVEAALPGLTARPLISVITPTWRADRWVLTECVDSLLAQSYEAWELCLVDDGTPEQATRDFVASLAERDPRIHVKLCPRNGGIARATNEALALAKGDFVAFLDHDDSLAPHALAEVALYVAAQPDTDLLYTDEDRLDSAARRRMPFFKPDWSPDLLRSCNYMCHFLVARRSVVEEVGRVREGYDGAQDYDLVLRLAERARHVGHLAEVLYHWRAIGESTALSVASKPKATVAGVKALSEHLARQGQGGAVKSLIPTHYRVEYVLPVGTRAAIVTADGGAEGLAESVGSAPLTGAVLCEVGGAPRGGARHVAWQGPFDLGAMYERARREVEAQVYVFVHGPLTPAGGEATKIHWLAELVSQALRPEVGVVGPRLVNADDTIQDAGWVLTGEGRVLRPFENMADVPEWTAMGLPIWTRDCLAVSPACIAVRAQVLEQLGGFTAGLEGAEAVLDLCLRAHAAGLRVVSTPHARLVHHAQPADPRVPASQRPQPDPYFNPHLSPAHTNGALRCAPQGTSPW